MVELQGIPVSPGVAIGPALVLDADGYRIPRTIIAAEDVAAEVVRLREATDAVSERLETSRLETSAVAGEDTGDIFAAQLQMLHDPRLNGELGRRIRDQNQSAAYAVNRVLHNYAAALRRLDNPLFADRAEDVLDIEKQLLFELGAVTRQPLSDLTEPVIVLSHVLSPSETANLDRRYVRGFCTETGGPGGHTAIVAKGLELPAVVGIGPFLDLVGAADRVIVDGDRGRVIIDPDEETLASYQHRLEQRESLSARLAELRDLPAETADGVRIRLNANIEFPHETAACLERGADGIGLYRTEFLVSGQRRRAERRRSLQSVQPGRSGNERSTGRSADAGFGSRQDGASAARPKMNTIRFWVCAAFDCRFATWIYSGHSFAPSCVPPFTVIFA